MWHHSWKQYEGCPRSKVIALEFLNCLDDKHSATVWNYLIVPCLLVFIDVLLSRLHAPVSSCRFQFVDFLDLKPSQPTSSLTALSVKGLLFYIFRLQSHQLCAPIKIWPCRSYFSALHSEWAPCPFCPTPYQYPAQSSSAETFPRAYEASIWEFLYDRAWRPHAQRFSPEYFSDPAVTSCSPSAFLPLPN